MFEKMELCHRPVHGSFPVPLVLNKKCVRLTLTVFLAEMWSMLFSGSWEVRLLWAVCVLGPRDSGFVSFSFLGEVNAGDSGSLLFISSY